MSSTIVSESEKTVELENILRQIFVECNNTSLSILTTHMEASTGNEVLISRIIEYVQDQLPACSTTKLQKYLIAVSTNDRVNWLQFKEASNRWITEVQQIQSQDGNNNIEKNLYNIMSDASNSFIKTDIDRNEILRMRVRKFDEENVFLREEVFRNEEYIKDLERHCTQLTNQLDRSIEKNQQFEKENDERKEKLDEIIKKEKSSSFAFRRSMKEQKNLLKQLEAAEIEVQAIPVLKEKIEKLTKEKRDCVKQIVKLEESLQEFHEKQNEYDHLKDMIVKLQETIISLKETYEYTIRNLREQNHQLTEQNMELKSWSTFNESVNEERLSLSSIQNTEDPYTHSTPYKPKKVQQQNSLYSELIAVGFTTNCNKNDFWKEELEEELNQYNESICVILQQLERVIQTFAATRGSTEVPQLNLQEMDTRVYNIEALKHKVAFLLNMATKEISKRITKDSSTQLRAEPDMIQDLEQFNITSFQDFLKHTHLKEKTDLQSMVSQCIDDNKDDLFLKIIKVNAGTHSDDNILDPLVEELSKIIQDTVNPPINLKNFSAHGNSRYRSIHTLHNSHSLKSDSPDILFAQGDNLVRENCFKGLTTFGIKSHNDFSEENLTDTGENPINEMPIISNLSQIDTKALSVSDEANVKGCQASQLNNTSPRRKISVYYRSFDVIPVQDQHTNHESDLLVQRSLSTPFVQENEFEETIVDYACNKNNAFGGTYRNIKDSSDSSSSSSPQKPFEQNLLDDEISVKQPVFRKVCLAPTRLKFPQIQENTAELHNLNILQETPLKDKQAKNEIDKVGSVNTNSCESSISSPCLSLAIDREDNESNNTSMHSSLISVVDNCTTIKSAITESKLYSVSDDISQADLASTRLIPYDQFGSTKIENLENPHSQTNVQKVGGQSLTERSVDTEMSNCENSSVRLNNEFELAKSDNQCINKKDAIKTSETEEIASAMSSTSFITSISTKMTCDNVLSQQNDKTYNKDEKQDGIKTGRRQRLYMCRSFSEDGNDFRANCRCKRKDKFRRTSLIREDAQSLVFPSLTDIRLQKSGIANLSDVEIERKEDLNELELQKRYTAFSLCLCTDRITLPRRMILAFRQRDLSERNLSHEIQKMQQDIQELTPLCTDRESVERVERVRHQLEMIAQCTHRVSCTAETLGAVHQEHRISRAIFLADKYLQVLQCRCEKLAANVAETKRILIENNIAIEETSGELNDELPRIRYRSGTPAGNRITMARRRASVATMSRPMGSTQDMIKDTMKQRNSVSGRVTLRRPSFSNESLKWENEEIDRTDFRLSSSSFSSVNELRDIFEQAESRRNSREENNNMLQISQLNSQNITSCNITDNNYWPNMKQEMSSELSTNEDTNQNCRLYVRTSQNRMRSIIVSWHMMLWGILIFFFGFYVNHAISMISTCSDTLNEWSVEGMFNRYVQIKNVATPPI